MLGASYPLPSYVPQAVDLLRDQSEEANRCPALSPVGCVHRAVWPTPAWPQAPDQAFVCLTRQSSQQKWRVDGVNHAVQADVGSDNVSEELQVSQLLDGGRSPDPDGTTETGALRLMGARTDEH